MKNILENAGDITLETSAVGESDKFCAIWPSVKSGLEILQNIIKNPIVKATIAIVIAAGDGVASKICK